MKTAVRAVRLLKQFTIDEPELGVIDLSHRLEMDRASVHRLLQSLCQEGVMQRNDRTRRYSLGPAISEIAAVRTGWPGVVEAAARHLDRLRDRTGEGAALSRTDGSSAICLAMVECRNTIRVVYKIGERIPLHCSASGLILLAHLDSRKRDAILKGPLTKFTAYTVISEDALQQQCRVVHDEGSAYTADTYLEGVRSVAAPVRDAQGRVVAAIAISVPSVRLSDLAIAPLTLEVQRCAFDISEELHAAVS